VYFVQLGVAMTREVVGVFVRFRAPLQQGVNDKEPGVLDKSWEEWESSSTV
jgi:hypothetical protein